MPQKGGRSHRYRVATLDNILECPLSRVMLKQNETNGGGR